MGRGVFSGTNPSARSNGVRAGKNQFAGGVIWMASGQVCRGAIPSPAQGDSFSYRRRNGDGEGVSLVCRMAKKVGRVVPTRLMES